MKIAMMTRWNVPTGLSAHAEPVGRSWLDLGHELKVFAPRGLDLQMISRDDEPFVHRCYMLDIWGEREREDFFFDSRPFLDEEYDIFLVEDAEVTPMPELLEIFPLIKRKAKTVLVVHEIGLPENASWYRFDWDAIVCFDVRYREFMEKAFPEDKISIIPFPCHPPLPGNKNEARKRLHLPTDRKIVLSYGFNSANSHAALFPVMESVYRDYPLRFVLLTHHTDYSQPVPQPQPEFLDIREEMPDTDKLYTYLHTSDAYIYYGRDSIDGVGISSCVATCLGAGCPVLVPGYCNFFDLSGKEVIKYGDLQQLDHIIRDVFDGAGYVRESLAAAREYATVNSGPTIAARFIELFETILRSSSPLAV